MLNPIHATSKAAIVSDKYKFIDTQQVVQHFQSQGWNVSKELVTKAKKHERIGYQKHFVRMRKDGFVLRNVGDSIPEIVIVNSHDGSSSLQLLFGIYRLVCANGLILGQDWAKERLNHTGNVIERLQPTIERLVAQADKAADWVNTLGSVQPTEAQRARFEREVAKLRLPSNARTIHYANPFTRVRRIEDAPDTAWHVFNRAQETLMRGGIRYQYEQRKEDGSTQIVRNVTREARGASSILELNQAVSRLANDIFLNVA